MSRRLFLTSVRLANKLHEHPEQWIGRPAAQIFELYQKRVHELGPKYQKSDIELNALLSTAKETGVPEHEIRRVYGLKGPVGQEDMVAGRLSGFNPLEDGALTKYEYDEYTTTAQDSIEQHREYRAYNRIAAYELPLLAKFRKEFVPPKPDQVLQVRYTSYLGEDHPAERKVVVKSNFEAFAKSEGLLKPQKHKLKLLLGKRYNQIEQTIHMSCEKFQYPAQNLKYLLVKLQQLVAESKSGEDFSDVPLDTRLYERRLKALQKEKKAKAFPKLWLRPQDAPQSLNKVEDQLLKGLSK